MNPENFDLLSDSTTEKVIFRDSNISQPSFVSIPNTVGELMLLRGVWRRTGDPYWSSDGTYYFDTTTGTNLFMYLYCTLTDIQINVPLLPYGVTMEYKIIGVEL